VRELSGHTTVVTIAGEHDFRTHRYLERQLLRARSAEAVVIDLSPCTFLDSTIMRTLLAAGASSLPRRVLLVLPTDGSIAFRALNLVRIDEFFPTHARLEDALTAAGPALPNA
jgi:anti-anti-sigma regulatory factor